MEQRIEPDNDLPAHHEQRLGVWVSARAVTALPGGLGAAPPEPGDPGLEWVAGRPDERASAQLTMHDLLAIWRSAERLLERTTEGGREWSLVREQIAALRVAYQRLFAQIRQGSSAR